MKLGNEGNEGVAQGADHFFVFATAGFFSETAGAGSASPTGVASVIFTAGAGFGFATAGLSIASNSETVTN